MFLSFEQAKSYFKTSKLEVVGNPIRLGILREYKKDEALRAFQLDGSKPTLFITGASQGAKIINDVLLLSIVELVKQFHLIHQCGEKNYEEVNARILAIAKEEEQSFGQEIHKSYRLYPTLAVELMALAYSAADIIISRGGSTIFEIAAVAKPAIIIPLANSGSNHQLANALAFSKYGGITITEDNFTPHILINEIRRAYEHRQELSARIKEFAKPSAAVTIAEELLEAGA